MQRIVKLHLGDQIALTADEAAAMVQLRCAWSSSPVQLVKRLIGLPALRSFVLVLRYDAVVAGGSLLGESPLRAMHVDSMRVPFTSRIAGCLGHLPVSLRDLAIHLRIPGEREGYDASTIGSRFTNDLADAIFATTAERRPVRLVRDGWRRWADKAAGVQAMAKLQRACDEVAIELVHPPCARVAVIAS